MLSAWTIKPTGVIHQEFDGEAVVVDLATGSYFSLTESAQTLWRQIAHGPSTVDALASTLVATYDVHESLATTDARAFLSSLEREGLIVSCPVPVLLEPLGIQPGARAAYAAPRVQAFRDLQDLFLLDPVHDVDPSAGWPVASGSQPQPQIRPQVVRRSGADLVSARVADTTIVVNRDRGIYSRLESAAADAWDMLQSGVARVSEDSFLQPLLDGGFLEPAEAPVEPSPTIGGGGRVRVEAGLADQIQAWGQRKRPIRTPSTTIARGLCDRLDTWFERTATVRRTSNHAIAGQRIQVDTPAQADCGQLAKALPGFGALGDTSPALVIRAWRGTPSEAPPVLANLIASLGTSWSTLCGPRGEVVDLHTDETSAIFDPGTGELSVIDRARGRAWAVKTDDRAFRFWELGSPFRFVLHDYFSHRGLQMVHAAAVADAARAALIIGSGGAGKSSTALASAAAGLHYLGDDYCLVDSRTNTVHCLYRTGKLVGPADLDRLPDYRGRSLNADSFERGGDGKAVYLVDEVTPGVLAATTPLRAILMPRVTASPTSRCIHGSAGDALEALLPSTVGQLPGADARDASRLADLVRNLPVVTLEAGWHAAGVADAVRAALRS